MPNRIIKESICSSETLACISPEAERFWWRLIVQCDDFGRMDGRPQVLRSRCLPLLVDELTNDDIERWLAELAAAGAQDGRPGLVYLYAVEGRRYIQVTNWERHQQKRAKHSKYPGPDMADAQPLASDSGCNQSLANVPEKRETRNEKRDARSETRARGGQVLAATFSPPADITSAERAILAELQQVNGYPLDYSRDLELIRALAVDFPSVDLLAEVKDWRAYILGRPFKARSNPRMQFRNWCKKALEIQAKRGGGQRKPAIRNAHEVEAREAEERARRAEEVKRRLAQQRADPKP